MTIKFDWDSRRRQGIVSGEMCDTIREHFSVENKTARFARMRGARWAPNRLYAITPTGRFDPGLYSDIISYINRSGYTGSILATSQFNDNSAPSYNVDADNISKLELDLRDYQKDIVDVCLQKGRGVTVLATAGGKTLTIATLLETIYNNVDKNFKCALIVPDLGLVEQTFSDFIDYGVSFSVSKWSGNNQLNLGTNVVVCNLGIIQSKNSDTSWLQDVDVCVVDEVHKLRKGNKVNKILKTIRTPHKFGFTGTMPEEQIDQWNIIGHIGSVIYERNSYELRKQQYVSQVKIQVLKLDHIDEPQYILYPGEQLNPTDKYLRELEFIKNSSFRNNVLAKLCNRFEKNSLIMVDYIDHGFILQKHLMSTCPNKKVYYIRGEIPVEDREKVKEVMEMEDNVVVIAISKIFSTGINIKNLHYIVFASGGKAKIKTIQSIGRGLRLHKDKSQLIIFDICDNLQYSLSHSAKRLQHYKKENIQYGVQDIKEKVNKEEIDKESGTKKGSS
jgi:superfamily II DNA or RNA helicase